MLEFENTYIGRKLYSVAITEGREEGKREKFCIFVVEANI